MQKATFQAGRCSGTRHNFRKYDFWNDRHIHSEKTSSNLYYDLRSGEMLPLPAGEACEEDIIRGAYTALYSEGLEARNARYRASRHDERCKGIEELYKAPKTRPKEVILQIGNMNEHATEEQLIRAVELYVERVQKYCEEHGIKHRFLSCAIHLDESTPHAHIKELYSAYDAHGHLMPMQEKCFRQAGVQLPDPAAPEGRYNNRTITFDGWRREMFEGICMELGIELDRERRSGRKHMQRQEYVIEQQAATIEQQRATIEQQRMQAIRAHSALNEIRAECAMRQAELKELDSLREREAALDQRLVREVANEISLSIEQLGTLPAKERCKIAAHIHLYRDQLGTAPYRVLCDRLLRDSNPLVRAEMATQGYATLLADDPSSVVREACKAYWEAHRGYEQPLLEKMDRAGVCRVEEYEDRGWDD